ncbi:MAG: hypothetical protein ACLU0O_10035 [Collinsella sp.]
MPAGGSTSTTTTTTTTDTKKANASKKDASDSPAPVIPNHTVGIFAVRASIVPPASPSAAACLLALKRATRSQRSARSPARAAGLLILDHGRPP